MWQEVPEAGGLSSTEASEQGSRDSSTRCHPEAMVQAAFPGAGPWLD